MSNPPDMSRIRVERKRRKYVQESTCGRCGESVERPCKNAAEMAFCPRVGRKPAQDVAKMATVG